MSNAWESEIGRRKEALQRKRNEMVEEAQKWYRFELEHLQTVCNHPAYFCSDDGNFGIKCWACDKIMKS